MVRKKVGVAKNSKDIERKLKESEEKYREMIEMSPDGILMINNKGFVISCNNTFYKLTGYSEKEIVGKRITQISTIPKASSLKNIKFFTSLLREKATSPFEFEWVHKNGSKHWGELYISRIKRGGKVLGLQVIARDITKQKIANNDLKESEEKYRNIVELTPQGIISVNLKGIVTSCNKSYLKQAGFSENEIVGKHFTRIPTVQKRDIPRYLKLFASIMRNKKPKSFEFEWNNKNGDSRLGNIHVGLIKKHGKLIGMQVFINDITENKKINEKMRDSSIYLDMMADAMMILDAETRLIRVNKAFSELWGYVPEEVYGKSAFEMFTKEELSKHKKEMEIAIKTDKRRVFETIALTKNKKKITVSVNATVLKDGKGKPRNFIALFRNNTKEKEAMEMIKNSEERLRILFENAPDGYYIMDLRGNFIDGNNVAEKITGYKKEELIGKNFSQMGLLKKSQIPMALKNLAQNALGKPTGPDEYTMRRKDGTDIDIEIRTHPVKIGNKTFILGIARDVSERKKSEEELQKLASVVRYSKELVNVSTPDGKMIFLNDFGGNMLGIDPKDVRKHTILEVIPDECMSIVKTDLLPKLIKGGTWEGDLKYKNLKTGKLTNVHAIAFSIKDPDTREILYLANVSQDITERKKAAEVIKKERDRAHKYLDVAGVIFVALNNKGEVNLINKKGCEVLGCRQNEIIGKNWFDKFVPERIRNDTKSVFQKLMRGDVESNEYYENPIIRRNNEEKIIAWHNIILKDEKGKITGTLSSGEDITEKKIKEDIIKKRTEESEKFSRLSVGRELKMIELKKKIRKLEDILKKHGIEPDYKNDTDDGSSIEGGENNDK
jgi:PAS domain S-box-containing protein